MTKEEVQQLSNYVIKWIAIDGLKPSNEQEFFDLFIKLLEDYPDDREITFDGDGAYFGKQVTLEPFSYHSRARRELRFEVAYSETTIRVYSANHEGFWYPEFISMDNTNPGFIALKITLFNFLKNAFGL
jgi:hypothetical protein